MPQAAVTAAISFPLAMFGVLVLVMFAQLPDWSAIRRWLRRP